MMDFITYLKSLPPEDWNKMATPQWTVKDVVAHMVGWEKRDAEIIPLFWKTKKREPWMSTRAEWDEFNRKEVERYKNYAPQQLLDEWRMWQGKIKEEIAAIGIDNIKAHPELFDWIIEDAGYYTLNDGGSHYEHHYNQIEKALRSQTKILITGIAGTGKSTIVKELNKKGVAAIDLHDVPGVFFWQDKKTGVAIEYAPIHSKDWFDTVDRLCDIKKVKEMFEQNPAVIMVGSTSGSNQNEFFSLFEKIILLQSNPETLIHRMQTRVNKSGYGKTEAEQEDNIEWQKEYDPLLISLGAIPVSTEGDLDSVVSEIVGIIKNGSQG